MNLFRWFNRPSRQRAATKSEAVIRRVVQSFRGPTMEVEPGLWSVTAERRNTYQVSLFLWAQDESICCMAGCEIAIERDLIPRELALMLLEENHRFEAGSFRLVPRDEKRLVVLGRTIDTRTFPEQDMHHLGEVLIEHMQRMVCKLYGMELIISGSEQPERRSQRH